LDLVLVDKVSAHHTGDKFHPPYTALSALEICSDPSRQHKEYAALYVYRIFKNYFSTMQILIAHHSSGIAAAIVLLYVFGNHFRLYHAHFP